MGGAGSHPGMPGAWDLLSCHFEDQQRTSWSRIEQVQRIGAALVFHQGLNAQASIKQEEGNPLFVVDLGGFLHYPSESRFEFLFDEYLPQKLLQFRCHGHIANFKSHCYPPARTPLVLQVLLLPLPLHSLLRQWYVLFNLTALKHNQNEMKHHATAVPLPLQFRPFLTMLVRFLTALCTP